MSCSGSTGRNPPVTGPQAGYPFQMYAYPQPPTVYGSYHSKNSMRLSIAQIVIGALCIVFNGVGIGFEAVLSVASVGLWGGCLFIVTGAFGISAAKTRTKCKITTFMILSIVSAATTVALFLCAVIGVASQEWYGYHCHRGYYNYYFSDSSACRDVAIAMNSLLAILAVAEAALATWGSVLCCKVYGCCTTPDNILMPQQYTTMAGGQPMVLVPLAHLNFEGPLAAYSPPAYPAQQTADDSAPANNGQDTVPLVPPSNDDDMEKVPL